MWYAVCRTRAEEASGWKLVKPSHYFHNLLMKWHNSELKIKTASEVVNLMANTVSLK